MPINNREVTALEVRERLASKNAPESQSPNTIPLEIEWQLDETKEQILDVICVGESNVSDGIGFNRNASGTYTLLSKGNEKEIQWKIGDTFEIANQTRTLVTIRTSPNHAAW